MKTILFVVGLLLLLGWGGERIRRAVKFEQQCGGFLDRAAFANVVENAKTELQTALTYLERKGLTNGYTSVLWRTPDEDIGFWYNNLQLSLQELDRVKPDASPLEVSNTLMKLHETLKSQGSEGRSSVRVPEGISIYPENAFYFYLFWTGAFLTVVGGVALARTI